MGEDKEEKEASMNLEDEIHLRKTFTQNTAALKASNNNL